MICQNKKARGKFGKIFLVVVTVALTLLLLSCETTKYVEVPIEDDFDYSLFYYSRNNQVDLEPEVVEEPDLEDIEWEIEDIPWEPGTYYTEQALRALYKQLVLLHRAGLNPNFAHTNEGAEAQIVKFTGNLSTKNWNIKGDDVVINRETTIIVVLYVWALYSFTNDCDFYVIEQEISIPNQNLWRNEIRYWLENYSMSGKAVEFYLGDLKINNSLHDNFAKSTFVWGHQVTYYDRIPAPRIGLWDSQPESANNVTTYSSSSSFNLGGNVGQMNVISPGINITVGKSYNLLDFSVLAMSMSNGTMDTSWEWKNNKPGHPPVDLAKSFATFGTSWVWFVENPEEDEIFRLHIRVDGSHVSSNKIVSGDGGFTYHIYSPWSLSSPYFELIPPIRVME